MPINMKCYYCELPATAKCDCSQYICALHLGEHMDQNRKHKHEFLEKLESERLVHLRIKTLKKLEIINELKNNLMLKSREIINSIQNELKKSLANLDVIINSYLRIINECKFDSLDMIFITKIEKMKLKVNSINIPVNLNQIKIAYAQEFFSYVEDVSDWRIQFLDTHVGGFLCGAVMGDSKTLITGGSDSVVRVWDLVQKIQIFTLHGHNSEVKCLALTKDSQHIISGSFDASVRIWNFQQKAQVGIFKGHNSSVYAVCYLERPPSIVSGDCNGELIVWDLKKLTIIKKLSLSGGVYSFILTKNQFNLIVGSNPDIIFYEFGSGSVASIMKGHSSGVLTLSLTSNEKKLVSGSDDNSIIIWDLTIKKMYFKLDGHSGGINSLTLTSNDLFIVSGSNDCTVRMWSMQTGNQKHKFSHDLIVNSIIRVDTKILSLSEDSGIGELDFESGKLQISWFLKPLIRGSITFKSDSGLIAYGSKNEAAIWDMNSELEKNALVGHNSFVLFVEISRDGLFAISCTQGKLKNLLYWNLKTNSKVAELLGHTSSVFCACFSKDGLTAASGSGDTTVRTWNLREARQEYEFKGHTDSIISIKFIDDKKLLVSAGGDKKVIIWSLINGIQHAVLNGHRRTIWKVLVSDDENFIISADLYEGIRIWNVDQLKLENEFSHQDKEAENWLNKNSIDVNEVKRFLKA